MAEPPAATKINVPNLLPDLQPSEVGNSELTSLQTAALELQAFQRGTLTPGQQNADWRLRFILRTLFFFFALVINLWWAYNVRCMLWQSGRVGTGFHLSDSVLIALLTTSIANFLALLTIIATHLFRKEPGTGEKR